MKITAIETIYLPKGVTVHVGAIQYLWVRIHTDEGLIGLGESYPNAEVEAAIVHTRLASVLLGRDPSEIDRLWADMFLAVSYSGWGGAEMRAISAVDIALWDLLGKATGQPVYKLLGGASRQFIRIYNTCYDRVDFLREPVQLARELLSSNIRAMKIWPFDPIAKEMQKGTTILRMRTEMFMPGMAALFGAGFDPAAPLMQMTTEAAELSSSPVPDSVFQVPEGYKEAPASELIKDMFAKSQVAARQ